MGLMVFRAAGSAYTVVGASPVEALTANSFLNTFTLACAHRREGGRRAGYVRDVWYCLWHVRGWRNRG